MINEHIAYILWSESARSLGKGAGLVLPPPRPPTTLDAMNLHLLEIASTRGDWRTNCCVIIGSGRMALMT